MLTSGKSLELIANREICLKKYKKRSNVIEGILMCYSGNIKSFRSIRYFKNLKYLDCSCTPLESLSGVETLTKLKILLCNVCGLKSLEPVKNLTNLEHFNFELNYINTFIHLINLNKIQFLCCISHEKYKSLKGSR